MYEITDPEVLLTKIEGELGSASRYAKTAYDLWERGPVAVLRAKR